MARCLIRGGSGAKIVVEMPLDRFGSALGVALLVSCAHSEQPCPSRPPPTECPCKVLEDEPDRSATATPGPSPSTKGHEPRSRLVPRALEGPFRSLGAYCAGFWRTRAAEDDGIRCYAARADDSGFRLPGGGKLPRVGRAHQTALGTPGKPATADKLGLAPPYREIRIFTVLTHLGKLPCSRHIAIRTDAGWFAGPFHEDASSDCGIDGWESGDTGGFDRGWQAAVKLVATDLVRGGRPEIVFEYRTIDIHVVAKESSRGRSYPGTVQEWQTHRLLICGIGPSNRPSCLAPLPLARLAGSGRCDRSACRPSSMKPAWKLEASSERAGRLTVALDRGRLEKHEPDDERAKEVVGDHAVVFP